MTSPRDQGFFMPGEWAPHSRCWMAWPCRETIWGEVGLEGAKRAYAEVARAIAAFEPVSVVANPADVAEVSLYCGSGIGALPLDHDDSWIRDSGPSFVIDGKGGVAGVDWIFNGWGEAYTPYDKDAALARNLLNHVELPRFQTPLVCEGGAIHVDGEGTLITTESVLLNANRNPDLGREEVERIFAEQLGIEKVIWLGDGLEDDDTGGHVDNLVSFARPGVVLAQVTKDEKDPNYEPLQENLRRLKEARDAKGRALEVIEIEQPRRIKGSKGQRLALSYMNFYVANGGIVMPSFEDSRDSAARDAIQSAFPDRKVVQIPALDIVEGGGGIHCITQQQPTGWLEPQEAEESGEG